MSKLFTCLVAAALTAAGATMAAAAQYPPGPGGTCPDTVTIVKVQDPGATCHPASGDTVYGARGVVIGFDKDFSPFAFWIQNGTAPYSGVQVFTGATNYFNAVPGTPTGGNIQLGDQIVHYGRVLEFNQMTELLDFDNSQSSNDIILRRLSAGNALPAFRIGTVDDFNWIPGNSAATAEPYEGMLVKIRGPLTSGRNSGVTGLGSRSFFLRDAVFPSDSAVVDGFSLTNVAALPEGTPVDSVQGILTQVTISGVNSYRILLRDIGDLFAPSVPPNLIDAYPIEDTQLRLVFDRDLQEASAENTANYSLGSFGLVNSATLVGGAGRIVVLDISNGLNDGDNESVTASGVVSSGGATMASPQSRSFVNGVLTIADIQAPNPTFLHPDSCYDRSRFTGTNGTSGARITYRGVCTASFGTVHYLMDPISSGDPGLRSGMPVFGTPFALVPGRKYLIAGQVQEFDGISTTIRDGLTEGVSSVYVVDEGAATIPAPRVQTIAVLSDSSCDVNQNVLNGEDYEGVLVRVEGARVTEDRAAGQSFFIAGAKAAGYPDTILVSNSNNSYTYAAQFGMSVNVTGVLTFRNGNLPFRILPRSNADIEELGFVGVGGTPGQLAFRAWPNPARTARLSFTLPHEGEVDLAVFDLAGRKLAQIARGKLPAGGHSRTWDGLAASGKRVGAGMYFYRLRYAGETRTVTGVLLD